MLLQDLLPVQVTILQPVAVQVHALAITVALQAVPVLVTADHPVVQVPVRVIALPEVRVPALVIVAALRAVLPEAHIVRVEVRHQAVHPAAVAEEAVAVVDNIRS